MVRVNYNDLKNGIHATIEYLVLFFENLLLGRERELKKRYMHVDYNTIIDTPVAQSAIKKDADEKIIKENPYITKKSLI